MTPSLLAPRFGPDPNLLPLMKRSLPHFFFIILIAVCGCSRSGVVDGASAPAPGSAGKAATPARIAGGQKVTLADYAVAGKTTIFDFTSQYCPPCRAIAPALHKLHAERADIAVVEVDVNRPGVDTIDWSSPVAQQYGLHSIPHFKVYGPDGKLKAEGDAAYELVASMLR
jgi:thiol-disulfide isomerase/thioredoxin